MGVAVSREKAMKWCKRSAEQGFFQQYFFAFWNIDCIELAKGMDRSLAKLGIIHYQGPDKQDQRKAKHYFKLGAKSQVFIHGFFCVRVWNDKFRNSMLSIYCIFFGFVSQTGHIVLFSIGVHLRSMPWKQKWFLACTTLFSSIHAEYCWSQKTSFEDERRWETTIWVERGFLLSWSGARGFIQIMFLFFNEEEFISCMFLGLVAGS